MPTEIKILPKDDVVNSPRHYLCPNPLTCVYKDEHGNMYIDALAVIKAWGFQANAYIFNLLKYVLRGGKKVGEGVLKDWKKGMFYFKEAIDQEELNQLDIPKELIKTEVPTFGKNLNNN